VALPAGASRVVAAPGATMQPDYLALDGSAPAPLPAPVAPGAVTDPGTEGDGARNHVRLRLDHPAWLVYAESYSSGWQAWCRDASGRERSLGDPVPIDGYANGWRVGADCREARFAFAPQRLADGAYLISAIAFVAMLLVLLVSWLRRRGDVVEAATPVGPAADPVRRLHPLPALACGAGAAGVGWFLFGPRAGLAVGAGVALALLVGVSVRRLIALATVALAAVPVLYVLDPAPRPSGLTFTYSSHHIAAHWVALAAVLALGAAGLIGAARLRNALSRMRRSC
jgi:hypothetical protein